MILTMKQKKMQNLKFLFIISNGFLRFATFRRVSANSWPAKLAPFYNKTILIPEQESRVA
jgi:hypothetical protein